MSGHYTEVDSKGVVEPASAAIVYTPVPADIFKDS